VLARRLDSLISSHLDSARRRIDSILFVLQDTPAVVCDLVLPSMFAIVAGRFAGKASSLRLRRTVRGMRPRPPGKCQKVPESATFFVADEEPQIQYRQSTAMMRSTFFGECPLQAKTGTGVPLFRAST
jgi:hypothetical protein